jgi:hypothetical protein
MRQDLAKVICEDGRRGPRGYMGGNKGYARKRRYRVAEDRDRDYASLESMPGHESMTARLPNGGRWFSENLGALRGLIARSCGSKWDTLYSELCRLVSPVGTNVQRHVHQHLEDFIAIRTRIGEQGIEHCPTGAWAGVWRPLRDRHRRMAYFVHPLSRRIVRLEPVPARPAPGQPPMILRGMDADSRHVYLLGVWYRIGLQVACWSTTPQVERQDGVSISCSREVVTPQDRFTLAIAQAMPAYIIGDLGPAPGRPVDLQRLRRHLFGADLIPVSKHGLNSRELRRLHLRNAGPGF